VPRLFFETDPPGACDTAFDGETDVLVYFLSLAFSTRYGAQHDLSRLALLLRGEKKIDLNPLTTFADRNVEVEADARELERVWQDAAPLAATLARVTEALASGDERIDALTRDTSDLLPRLRDLQRLAECARDAGARVRLSYEL